MLAVIEIVPSLHSVIEDVSQIVDVIKPIVILNVGTMLDIGLINLNSLIGYDQRLQILTSVISSGNLEIVYVTELGYKDD